MSATPIDVLLQKYRNQSLEDLNDSYAEQESTASKPARDKSPYNSKWAQPLNLNDYAGTAYRYEPQIRSQNIEQTKAPGDQIALERLFKMIDAAEQDTASKVNDADKKPLPKSRALQLPPRPATAAPPVPRKTSSQEHLAQFKANAVLRKTDSGIGASSENLYAQDNSVKLAPPPVPRPTVAPSLPKPSAKSAVAPERANGGLGVLYFRLKRLDEVRMSAGKSASSAYVYLVIRHGNKQSYYTKAVSYIPGQPVELQSEEISVDYLGSQIPLSIELHCRVDGDSAAGSSRSKSGANRNNTLKGMFKSTGSSRPSLSDMYSPKADSATLPGSRSQSVMSNASSVSLASSVWPKAQTGLVGCLDVVNIRELTGTSQLTAIDKTVSLNSLIGTGAGSGGFSSAGAIGAAPIGSSIKGNSTIKGFFKSLRRKSSSDSMRYSNASQSRTSSVMDFADSSIAKLEMELAYVPNPDGLPKDQFPASLTEFTHWMAAKDWHNKVFAQGYLSQRGGDLKYWRRRHFLLIGSKLVAFKESDCKDLRYQLDLACCDGEFNGLSVRVSDDFRNSLDEDEMDEVKIPFGFRIEYFKPQTGERSKTVEFYAANDEEKASWIERIAHVIESANRYRLPAWYLPIQGYPAISN